MILTKRQILALLKQHGLKPKHHLGQNFLIDRNFYRYILEVAQIQESDFLVEVGTGLGTLTGCLAEKAKQVLTIEKDAALLTLAKEHLSSFSNILYYEGDVLFKGKLAPWTHLLPSAPVRSVSNLPYQIASLFLVEILYHLPLLPSTFLIQREVAEKLVASPRSKNYGRLTVMIQSVASVTLLRHLSPRAFFPAPKVESTLIQVFPQSPPSQKVAQKLSRLTAHLFGRRRKKLRKTLESLSPLSS